MVDLISDVTSSLTGHDIPCDDFPEEMYGKRIMEAIMGSRVEKGMPLRAVDRNMKNMVNLPFDMAIKEGDRMVVLVGMTSRRNGVK